MSKAITATNFLLSNDAGLIARVPAASVFSGTVPQSTPMPAIGITHVSTDRRKNVRGDGVAFCITLLDVTVMAADYSTRADVLDLVLAALPRSRGLVNGVAIDAVIHVGQGPDFDDSEAGLYFGSHQFRVTFNDI